MTAAVLAASAVVVEPEFRALIPPLSAEEYAQLEANLLAAGRARDPLASWRGVLLDGHNRHEICERLGLPYTVAPVECADRDAAMAWIIRNQFGRRNLQLFQRAELALKLEPLIAARAKAQQGTRADLSQKSAKGSADTKPIDTRKEIAKIAGVSHDTIAKVKTIAEYAPEAVKEALRRGDSAISINSAYQDIRGLERRQARVERIQGISANNEPLDLAPVPVLYVDPPWRFEHVKTDNRALENHYPTMSPDEICTLPVNSAATADAILFLWAPSPKLAEAIQVIAAWGFLYRTCMVWTKDKIGMGSWARQQHELLLIAVKGDPPIPLPANLSASVVHAPRGRHSEKPEAFYEVIERMYPEFRKRELFARQARAGWETPWGNQAPTEHGDETWTPK